MARKTYYQVLEVAQEASPEEIRAAYRRLIRRYHPDLNPNDPAAEERTRAINDAYATLSDGAQHAAYDRRLAIESRRQVRVSVSPPAAGFSSSGCLRVSFGSEVRISYSPTAGWVPTMAASDVMAEWLATRFGLRAELWRLFRMLAELSD